MNVTNFANLFPQNNIFQQNLPLGQKFAQPPVSDALNRLSENLLSGQNQAKNLKARFDTLELSAADRQENSPLADVPEDLLHFYLHLCKFGANLSQGNEASLTEYRDQLSAFDQSIQEYQDMLSGKAALPGQMKREDVSFLLAATKAAREQFLQEGAEKLNQISRESPVTRGFLGKAYHLAAGGKGDGQEDPCWQIDASAKDIYAEIDRALEAAHQVTSTFQDGASGILAELKRRGCVQAGEECCFEAQGTVDEGARMRASLFQSIYDDIWNTFRHSIREKQEERQAPESGITA